MRSGLAWFRGSCLVLGAATMLAMASGCRPIVVDGVFYVTTDVLANVLSGLLLSPLL